MVEFTVIYIKNPTLCVKVVKFISVYFTEIKPFTSRGKYGITVAAHILRKRESVFVYNNVIFVPLERGNHINTVLQIKQPRFIQANPLPL